MTNPYVPLLIMSAAALVLAFGGLVASAILGPTKKSTTKADNYECGIQPTSAHLTEGRFNFTLQWPLKMLGLRA